MKWYNAKEARPVKNCRVWIITVVFGDKTSACLDTTYYREPDVFGSEQYPLSPLYWAYAPKIEEIDPEFDEEDDF